MFNLSDIRGKLRNPLLAVIGLDVNNGFGRFGEGQYQFLLNQD